MVEVWGGDERGEIGWNSKRGPGSGDGGKGWLVVVKMAVGDLG